MKKTLLILMAVIIFTPQLSAAGYSNWAVPEYVELVSGGILVKGNFGDPNNCGRTTEFFYLESEPNFDAVLSFVLAAITAKKELRYYSGACHQVQFHHATPNINRLGNGQALFMR